MKEKEISYYLKKNTAELLLWQKKSEVVFQIVVPAQKAFSFAQQFKIIHKQNKNFAHFLLELSVNPENGDKLGFRYYENSNLHKIT